MDTEPNIPELSDTAEPDSPDTADREDATNTAASDAHGAARPKSFLVAGAIVAVLALVASQVYVISSITSARDDIAAIAEEVSHVNSALEGVNSNVDALSRDLANVAAQAAGPTDGGISPAPSVSAQPTGVLPRFENGAPDTALGLTMTPVEATEAYSQETVSIDPTDGTKRIWLIWAHWCPYCQQELPDLSTWYLDNAQRFPSAELVTVTTSMDPSRGNPLDEYLETEQFNFPVLVDETAQIASQFGVSAFPFWVVTGSDGTVLYRTAGLIGPDAIEQLFTQLEQVE